LATQDRFYGAAALEKRRRNLSHGSNRGYLHAMGRRLHPSTIYASGSSLTRDLISLSRKWKSNTNALILPSSLWNRQAFSSRRNCAQCRYGFIVFSTCGILEQPACVPVPGGVLQMHSRGSFCYVCQRRSHLRLLHHVQDIASDGKVLSNYLPAPVWTLQSHSSCQVKYPVCPAMGMGAPGGTVARYSRPCSLVLLGEPRSTPRRRQLCAPNSKTMSHHCLPHRRPPQFPRY
jgi:hypothetical protein